MTTTTDIETPEQVKRPGPDRSVARQAWGERTRGGGRLAHVAPARQFEGTTTQVAGLYPFTSGSGAPQQGVPVGRNLFTSQELCCDVFAWHELGLIASRGMWVQGVTGVGKSAWAKRQCLGLVHRGIVPVILGDPKNEFTSETLALDGQVIRIGRGRGAVNPLDAGPLGSALVHLTDPAERERLLADIRARRIAALSALISLVAQRPMKPVESQVLGDALDLVVPTQDADPTVPQVLALLDEAPLALWRKAHVLTRLQFHRVTRDLAWALGALCSGPLAGVYDRPTTTAIDLAAPMVSIDISGATGSALETAAAMLSTWSYGFSVVTAAGVLAQATGRPRPQFLAVMDELWRALRGAPGLVQQADELTRIYRGQAVGHLMLTHSLEDMEALESAADRAKARTFIDRCPIRVLGALPARELDTLGGIVRLTDAERAEVARWNAGASNRGRHPGRGKYLIKTGDQPGAAVQMSLTGAETRLYETDEITEGRAS